LVLPAAGLPTTRDGNAFAVKASHFFATSALTALAPFVMDATAMKTEPTTPAINFGLGNIGRLLACADMAMSVSRAMSNFTIHVYFTIGAHPDNAGRGVK
jgi:hypothetical protein